MDKTIFPKYGEASLADIPGTVLSLFDIESELGKLDNELIDTGQNYQNVVVVLIDGLGRAQLEDTSEKFFENMVSEGSIDTVTSVFPSATPATLTSLNTGLVPREHGLLGWDMYYSEVDSNIFTLPFVTPEGEKPQDVFEDADPEMLFEGEPIYPKLSENGVKCFSIVKGDLIDSEYTELVKKGF